MKNVDFGKLSAKPTLMKQCISVIKGVVASEGGQGLKPEHVDVTLSAGWPGEVMAEATINSPRGVDLETVQARLSSDHTGQQVLKKVMLLDGISNVSAGTISVEQLSVKGQMEREGGAVIASEGVTTGDITTGQLIAAGSVAVLLAVLLLFIMHVHTYPLPDDEDEGPDGLMQYE